MILRQIPGQRQCWEEMESNSVTAIDPLLLNFNFAGSCERSTDSNGYSLRLDGEDYGLEYLLRIVERNGELVLVATHRSNPSQPEIIIGRTQGIISGFLKIDLDPGWRFTQRAYNGKILSHVYLTGDSTAILPQPPSRPNNTPTEDVFVSESDSPIQELTFIAETQPSVSSFPPQPSPVSSGNTFSSQPSPNTLPPPPTPSVDKEPLPLPNFSELPPLQPPATKSVNGVVPSPPPNAVNTGRNSLGNGVGSLSRPTATPQGYRVVVAVNNSSDKTRVRSLFPEAFSTSYQGRSMLQVGLFSDKNNAEKAEQSLKNVGLKPIIVP